MLEDDSPCNPTPPRPLLVRSELERSEVVANNSMNRRRGCTGVNSYERELGFDPLSFLQTRMESQGRAAWLDIACGEGWALGEAATRLGSGGELRCVGLDLAGCFQVSPGVQLIEASLFDWSPQQQFDLITCVHGLHYFGDKLEAVRRAADWLTDDGRFTANLDSGNLRREDGTPIGAALLRAFKRQGVHYSCRAHRLNVDGRRPLEFPWRYLGANDAAGPNYTHQPVVHSIYAACSR